MTRAKLSFISPEIAWTREHDIFVLTVSCHAEDFALFISDGHFDVPIAASQTVANTMKALLGKEGSLRAELIIAATNPQMLRPADWRKQVGTTVRAYFVTATLLPSDDSIAIVASRKPHTRSNLFPPECVEKSTDLTTTYREATSLHEALFEKRRQELDARYERPEMQPYKSAAIGALNTEELSERPRLITDELLPLLPRGTVFELSPKVLKKIDLYSGRAISESGLHPSRDGSYSGFSPDCSYKGALALMSWDPYSGPPALPEVQAALEQLLPAAFRKPRISELGRPDLRTAPASASASLPPGSTEELWHAFDDLHLESTDADTEKCRQEMEEHGFDAIAWYQPYHVWNENSWGIYFDSAKLDSFARMFVDDLTSSRVYSPHQLAAFLAVGMVLEHEFFHARVEFSASWLELTSLKPLYNRYHSNVYETLPGTSEWLEEALANWSSWVWFHSEPVQELLGNRYSMDHKAVSDCLESALDLAPPGYRDWRKGKDHVNWRILATQLLRGQTRLSRRFQPLPVESILTGPLPYDAPISDVPVRFVGPGVIADRLLGSPANFNVPARSEVQCALKYFKHIRDPKGGKGSHEKWTGPDERVFILPGRDPVSGRVFRTFLHHVGIDKSTYIHEVRPKL